MLTFIAILIYILSVMIFSEYAPDRSTNWSIFYFSSLFISFSLITINEIIKSFDKYVKLLLLTCLLFFLIMLFQQLLLINKPYEHYYLSVNDNFVDNARFIFFTIILGVISFKYLIKWVKQHRKY